MGGLQGEMGQMGNPGRDAMRVINLPGPMGRSLSKYRFSKYHLGDVGQIGNMGNQG